MRQTPHSMKPIAVAALMVLDLYWDQPQRGARALEWIEPVILVLGDDISRVDLAYAVLSALNAFESLESL